MVVFQGLAGWAGLFTVMMGALPGIASAAQVTVSSVEALMEASRGNRQHIVMTPGSYAVGDYLTDERLARVGADYDRDTPGRRPLPVLTFGGSDNTYDLTGVTLVVDTSLFEHLPTFGKHRFFFVTGHRNTLRGLTIRYVGPQRGMNGVAFTLWGDGNTLEDATVYVHGSGPYGYGDLLGKGKPGLAKLRKHSGILIGGDDTTLRRCRVISRAFGHCFVIQGGRNTLLEDCYAEGITRSTSDMLRERGGEAEQYDYRSVYENRDGRFVITPGYRKSLTEDGFRTYGKGGSRGQTTGKTTLINCTAINTRAGFEIVRPVPEGESLSEDQKTTLIGCTALGTERAFLLINGNIVAKRCRGDIVHGPVLYLWRGSDADVEIEVVGKGSDYTVHALATISGENHRVKLTRWAAEGPLPALPIMLGFGMPAHAEMATPILEESASGITLINETGCPVIEGSTATDNVIELISGS